MWSYIKSEPAVLLAVLGAAIDVGTAFGLELTAKQIAAIGALTALVLGLVTRQLVTPVSKAT